MSSKWQGWEACTTCRVAAYLNVVIQVIIGKDGSKWFIHGGFFNTARSRIMNANGVSHLKKDGTIETFHYDKGLPSGLVYCIAFDIDNSTWFGTNGGLTHLKNDGSFETFHEKDGLPSDFIRHISIDKNGRKWLATEGGVAIIDRDGKITSLYVPGK